MITYPALARSSVVKRFEFDDVRYTVELLLAMGECLGTTLQQFVRLLDLSSCDVADLIEDAPCNHSLPFAVAVSDMLGRFGAQPDVAPVPSFGVVEAAAEVPSLLVGIVAFNSDLDEAQTLHRLMEDGTLDWLGSDDFKSLPVPLNQVAGEWLRSPSGVAA